MKKSVFVFVARDHEEFCRYPDGGDGYCVDEGSLVPFRYKEFSKSFFVVVLDDFQEKRLLRQTYIDSKKNTKPNEDCSVSFAVVIAVILQKIPALSQLRQCEISFFIHWGGLRPEVAEKLSEGMRDRVRQYNYNKEVVDFLDGFFDRSKGPEVFSISTQQPERLNLSAPKVILPNSQEGFENLKARCKGSSDIEKIRRAFVNRWEKKESH